MISLAVAMLHLVILHTVDGREVSVNPEQVTSLQTGVEGEKNKVLVETVKCVVGLTNGKFISVVEHCDAVKKMLENAK
jgi:hypothetical protein